MNIFEAITTFGTTRDFEKDVVDEKEIGLILHIGTYAPSAGNLQEWQFVVVEDDGKKALLSEAALGLRHIRRAPAVIVICADLRKMALKYGKRGELVYAAEDAGACAAFMGLAASAIGVGFDLVRSFDENEVSNILSLPENIRPMVLMPIGHTKVPKRESAVNPFENITSVDSYGHKIDIQFKSISGIISDYVKRKK